MRTCFVVSILAPLLAFSHLLNFLGLKLFTFFGAVLGDFLYFIHFRRKIVVGNLRLALGSDLSVLEHKRLCHLIYRNIGIVFLSIARNFSLKTSQIQKELHLKEIDREKINKILTKGQGAVFISAHIANWELFAMGMAAHGFPVSIVVKKMNNHFSQALIERLRLRTGLGVIYSGNTLQKIRSELKQGRAIGFMVDQNTTGKKGIRVNFFGTPASSIRGLANLVRETGAIVVPICAFRLPSGEHEVRLMDEIQYIEALEWPIHSRERMIREEWLNTSQYQLAIEKLIREQPEQWLWIHRRWKTSRDPLSAESGHEENLPLT